MPPELVHDKLDVLVKSAALSERTVVLDLKDHQRALVWIDGRFSRILAPGLYVYWTELCDVRVEIIDAREVRFDHEDHRVITRAKDAARLLDICTVARDSVGVLFIDGEYVDTLAPGRYAFWRDAADTKVVEVDLRETIADVNGQDIMKSDKVTLRLNAVVTYRVREAHKAVSETGDAAQALYREMQLAVRAAVGARDLDTFLVEKDAVAQEVEQTLRDRVDALGLEVASVGVRDVILPGEMKDLMNKVTEAKKQPRPT